MPVSNTTSRKRGWLGPRELTGELTYYKSHVEVPNTSRYESLKIYHQIGNLDVKSIIRTIHGLFTLFPFFWLANIVATSIFNHNTTRRYQNND